MEQNRFKSWNLWLSLAALICFVCKQFFGTDIDEAVNTTMNIALPCLIGLGVINNPNNKTTI